jgi:hypothetical protein
MRTVTATTLANIGGKVNIKPELIVSIDWGDPFGVRYYGERSFYLGNLFIEGSLLQTGQLVSNLNAENVASISSFNFTLDLSKDDEDSVLDILDENPLENRPVRVYQYFNDPAFLESDLLLLFYGRAEGESVITPVSKTISITASTASLDTYNVGLKRTEEIENPFICEWLDIPTALWNSTRGNEVIVNPSSLSPVYETRKGVDSLMRDGVPGYISIRLRDSSPTAGDLAYRATGNKTIPAGQYSLFLAFQYFAEKNYISYPESEYLALVFDPTTNFTGTEASRLFVPINFSLEKDKWRRRRVKFDLDADFTYQSMGFAILRDVPDNHFLIATISLADGSAVPAPNPDRWIKFRIDGLKLCQRQIYAPGLSPLYFLDDEDAWPIVFGCVKHVPALRITSVPLTAVSVDFELHSDINAGPKTFEVANSSKFPQDVELKLTIEHITTNGQFRRSVIKGKFISNTFYISDTNPSHFDQILDLYKRDENSEFFNNSNYAWLKSENVFDLRGRLLRLNYDDVYPAWPVLGIGQSGTRFNFRRIADFDSGLPILEETEFVPFEPIPSLIGRVPPILITTGPPLPHEVFPEILVPQTVEYGSPEHIAYENKKREDALTATVEGYVEELGSGANIKDVRNFPTRQWSEDAGFNKGSYTILAGSLIFFESEESGIKYIANLYPSDVVDYISATKGESVEFDEGTNEIVTENGTVRTGILNADGLTVNVGAVALLSKVLSSVTKNIGGQTTTEINTSKLAAAGSLSGGLISPTKSIGSASGLAPKLKKSTVINFNTTGVNNSGQVLKEVPRDYYTVELAAPFADHMATIITLESPLEEREGENWGGEIYVTLRSSLPSNLARIIAWIIDNYVFELEVDEDSFIPVSTKIQDLPGNFAIFGNNNARELIQSIAWLAKCGVIYDGNIVRLKYLDERPI